jgi:hypothetical protein
MNDNYEVKFQYINLRDALIRNLNDNFISVSFEIIDGGDVQTQFILSAVTETEMGYIADIMAEFSLHQFKNTVLPPKIVLNSYTVFLENVVFSKRALKKTAYFI